MTELADRVLPLIRTRADLHRWSAANAHGEQMHEALTILEETSAIEDPADVLAVTQRAIDSAIKVILRANDSSGIIGDAIRGLLRLHAELATRAQQAPAKLVAWMIKFQFGGVSSRSIQQHTPTHSATAAWRSIAPSSTRSLPGCDLNRPSTRNTPYGSTSSPTRMAGTG